MDALNPENLDAFLKLALEAITSRNYALLVVLGVIAATYALRKFGGAKFPFLRTDRAGVVLAFLTALAGTLGAAFLSGTGFTWLLLGKAAVNAFLAIGGYAAVKKFLGYSNAAEIKATAKAVGEAAAAKAKTPTVISLVRGGYDANGSPTDDSKDGGK